MHEAVKDTEELSAESLFAAYRISGSVEIRNKIVLRYMNIVNYAAISTKNMYQKFAETEDIVNEATIALMKAVDSYNPDKNTKFETYASIRVRGAVIDYIRRQDIIPRNVRKFAQEYDKVYSLLYSRLDREPLPQEIADEMGITVERLESYTIKAASAQVLSFEEMVFENGYELPDGTVTSPTVGWEPEKNLLKDELKEYLAAAVEKLTKKEKLVVSLYYYEKLKYSEIAQVMEVSESRVCQLNSAAVIKIKKYLKNYL